MASTAEFVIGLGASAGGLEALERFFDGAPDDAGAAYVVVMHLSRDFKSMLDELLARHTKMPVVAAVSGLRIEPNKVYVIQPATILEVEGTRFVVKNRPTVDPTGLATTVNIMFQSLAKHWGNRCGVVVLSGSGSDGAEGIIAVRNAGGFTAAQSPETAKFDFMPVSAISTGKISAVEAPEQLADTIIEGIQLLPTSPDETPIVTDRDDAFALILKAVVGVSGLDAAKYKHSTFERRVKRRMMDLKINALPDYAELISRDDSEARNLRNMLLIGVTEFFRDAKAFQTIQQQVVPELIRRAHISEKPIRIWVPGCATGEEAYSLAILFANAMRDMPAKIEVQIFATDVKREHLTESARGEYSLERMKNISEDDRQLYFRPVEEPDRFVVVPEIRKMIVFAPHDVLADPPFTKLDMVSCRNLLIYFSIEAQQKIISGFAFGLNEKGFLFMGSSETVGAHREAFEFIDVRNRVFRRTASKRMRPELMLRTEPVLRNAPAIGVARNTTRSREIMLQPAYGALLKSFAPASLLVSRQRELLHTFGEARKFLRAPDGIAHLDVTDMVDSTLRTPILAGIDRAAKDKESVTFSRVTLAEFPETGMVVDVTVQPLDADDDEIQNVLVIIKPTQFESVPQTGEVTILNPDTLSAERIADLELELDRTREALQSTIEEIETANEELQSANEELMSSNEELQSTNEELSSVNEELYSVNSEYHRQNDDLINLSKDFDILLQSTEIGVIFLDEDMNITRFTQLASDLFGLEQTDIGRSIARFKSPFPDFDPSTLFIEAMTSDGFVEHEAVDSRGTAWLMRAIVDFEHHGAVLTLINIGQLRQLEQEARLNAEMLESLQEMANAFYFEVDARNQRMLRELGWFQFTELRKRKTPYKPKWGEIHEDEVDSFIENIGSKSSSTTFDEIYRVWNGREKAHHFVRLRGQRVERGGRLIWRVTGMGVDEIVANERKATQQERVLSSVLRASTSRIALIDTNERYRFANEPYLAQFDETLEGIIGRSVSDVLPSETYKTAKSYLKSALKGERQEYDIERVQDDGTIQHMTVVYDPIIDAEDNVTGITVDALDISRFYQRATQSAANDHVIAEAARHSSYAIIVADAETMVVEFANPEAKRRLGLPDRAGVPAGVLLSRLTPEWGDTTWKRWIATIKPGKDDFKQDIAIYDPNQDTVLSDIFVAIVEEGKQRRAVIRMLENGERAQSLDELRARTRQLAGSNRDLEQFAAAIAHDLRAPLRHISQFTGFLRDELDDSVSADALEYMAVVSESSGTLTQMVDALLDFARLGRSVRSFKTVNMSQTIKSAMGLLQTEIEESGAEIKVGRMLRPQGDKELLVQVFQNIIGNALKYRKKKTKPIIDISSSAQDGMINYRICDNGIGIHPDMADRIFQLFQRLHSEKEYPGLGVGLATCRRICEAHGGSLNLDNSVTEGSCFVVSLPSKSAKV
jgi:two-component system CheB/CheR fusion protein